MTDWLTGRVARREIVQLTADSYAGHIASFVDYIGADTPVDQITTETIEAWIASLRTRYGQPLAPSALNTKTATIRGFWAWALERNYVDRNPMTGIKRAKVPRRPPKSVPPEQVAAVLSTADFRVRTMILLMVQLGLRRSELAGLTVEDWDRDNGFLYVRGKGSKDRNLPLTSEATEALEAWLADGRLAGPMWPSSHRPGEGIAVRTVSNIIGEAAKDHGLRITPHAYRHTAATDALANGATVDGVRRILGHESLATTTIYLHTKPEDLREQIGGRNYFDRPRKAG